jgi:preprotein translocase subunit Sec61beta
MSQKKSSRRKKRRSGSAPMPSGGAGLMRFFEDTSIGIKVSPGLAVGFSVILIVVVVIAHLGLFQIIFSPASGGG